MADIETRLREAHPESQQYAMGSNILLEAADQIAALRGMVDDALAERDKWRGHHTKVLQERNSLQFQLDAARAQCERLERRLELARAKGGITGQLPLQPIVDGRFRPNSVVEFLLNEGPHDMNTLAMRHFNREDQEQFAQLIGYSLGGFSELSYISDETYERAALVDARLRQQAKENSND